MDINLSRSAEKYRDRHRRNRIWKKLVSILGCVVVFCTTYALILPAITMERETVCGKLEHRHEESCYTLQAHRRLVCSGQTIGVHTHTVQCADGSCGYADFVIHSHDASCYDASGALVCALPQIVEHIHTEGCYRIPTRQVGEHTHMEECYALEKGALTCSLPETDGHTHSENCYSQKQTLCCTTPERDGHKHGDGCFDEAGGLICTQEESDGHHHGDGCYTMETVLTCGQAEAQPHHHTDDCYCWDKVLVCGKEAGPILEKGEPELICTKKEIKAHRHTASCFDAGGNRICGQPEILTHTHTESCFDTTGMQSVLTCTLEEHTHTEDCYPTEETTASTTEVTTSPTETTTSPTEQSDTFAMLALRPLAEADLYEGTSLPVTGISGTDTIYDKDTDLFSVKVNIDFDFGAKNPSAGTVYTYTYPVGVVIPSGEITTDPRILYDRNNDEAGTFQFVDNGDGTFSVQVVFSETYLSAHSNNVNGYVHFTGTFDKNNLDDSGNIAVGESKSTILVRAGQITYPKDETAGYDIDVSKSGSLAQDGNRLNYTVYVHTTKGTPSPIQLSDVITIPEGLALGDPSVKVEQGTALCYYADWDKTWKPNDNNDWNDVTGVVPTYDNGTLSMDLPGLSAEETKDSNNRDCILAGVYKITYSYDITGQTVASVSPSNTVSVQASDRGQSVSDSATSKVDINKHSVQKSGAIDAENPNLIRWEITVNSNQVDINGAVLTDEMLKQAVEDSENGIAITVSPDENASITKTDGTITFGAADGGSNTNTYTITYYTSAESWTDKTISNNAKLDPTPGTDGDERYANAYVNVQGVGLDKAGAVNSTNDGIAWTITVNSGGKNIAGATLKDEMFEALQEADFSIEPADASGYAFTYTDGKITGMTFSELTQGSGENTQWYVIKYTTPIETDSTGAILNTSVTNKAILSKNDTDKVEKEYTVNIEQPGLEKGGTYSATEGKINWTITVNKNKKNIAGVVLTDDMFGQLTAADIKIQKNWWGAPGEGECAVNVDTNGNVTGISFNAIGDTGVNDNMYVIMYATAVSPEWNDKVVSNTAKLDEAIEYPADVIVPGIADVSKQPGEATVSDDGYLIIPWKITMNIPSTGLDVVDDVTSHNTNQWMTQAQADELTVVWVNDSGEAVGPYELSSEQIEFTPGGDDNYSGFIISFPEGVTPPDGATKLCISYSATADSTIGQNTYHNHVDAGGQETDASYTYYKPGVVKTDGSGSTEESTVSSDGTLTWKIMATAGKGNTTLTLTDTLPEGVRVTGLRLDGSNVNTDLVVSESGAISAKDSPASYTIQGNIGTGSTSNAIVSVTIAANDTAVIPVGAQFTLTLNCKVNDPANQEATADNPKTLTNEAKMTLDDIFIGASSQTQNWVYKNPTESMAKVGKTGEWNNSDRIMKYAVVLNPTGDLLADGGTLTLTDVMKYDSVVNIWSGHAIGTYTINAELIRGSVKLSELRWNTDSADWDTVGQITDWTWTYTASNEQYDANKKIHTIQSTDVPNGKPLLLEYQYKITSDIPNVESYGLEVDLPFSNSVTLEGVGSANSVSKNEMKWRYSGSGAGVSTRGYTFCKVETGNYGKVLPGAGFSVYAYDTEQGDWGTDTVHTYTTDSNGTFTIQKEDGYQTNVLYKIVETTPPEGYLIPDNQPEYTFYFSPDGQTEEGATLPTLPTGEVMNGAVDLTTESPSNAYIGNAKNITEITVEKQWQDQSGNPVQRTTGEVTIQLYQTTSPNSGSDGGTRVGYSANCNGQPKTGEFAGVSVGDKVKVSVTYTWEAGNYGVEPSGWTGVSAGTGSYSNGATTYDYVCTIADSLISFNTGDQVSSIASITCTLLESGSAPTSGTGYGEPVVLHADSDEDLNWRYTFTNLPLTYTDESGNTVTYYYYVREASVSNYTTRYSNNSGITSGTITVTNRAVENPSYELPDTGGAGAGGYVLGGGLVTATALWLLLRKRRRRGDVPSA